MVATPQNNVQTLSPASGAASDATCLPGVQLLTCALAIRTAFQAASEWAEEFVLCTPALDSDSGQWPLWCALRPHFAKLRHAYVAIDGLKSEPAALQDLHARGSLRLVSAENGSFRANLLRFRNGDRTRVILGGGTLCPPGNIGSIDVMILWAGPSTDAFALQIESLIEQIRLHGRVADLSELDAYSQAHFAGKKAWDRIAELEAPFMREPIVEDPGNEASDEAAQEAYTFLFVTTSENDPQRLADGQSVWWSCGKDTRQGDTIFVYVTGEGIRYQWRAASDAEPHPTWRYICDVAYESTFDPAISPCLI